MLWCLVLSLGGAGCATPQPATGAPVVVDGVAYAEDNALGDLYVAGAFLLRDRLERLWLCEVFVVPGTRWIGSVAGESWRRTGRRMASYGDAGTWVYCGDDMVSGLGFALEALGGFGLEGVATDLTETTASLADEFASFEIGWLWRVPGRALRHEPRPDDAAEVLGHRVHAGAGTA
jgi:hypothetical protein